MKYLVVILIIVLLFLILKNDLSEKFKQELVSPEVIEAIKNNNEATIKFKNQSKEKRKFMIFYINTETPQSGIWVEKKIECSEEICKVKLSDLEGARYHMVIVESDDKNMSSIDKIIKFGDGQAYTPYDITPVESYKEINTEEKEVLNSEVNPEKEVFNNKEAEDDKESDTPSPYVICGRNPKVKYVEDKTDMENIEVRSKCAEDKDILRLKKKNRRSLWNEFKKGYLYVDIKSGND